MALFYATAPFSSNKCSVYYRKLPFLTGANGNNLNIAKYLYKIHRPTLKKYFFQLVNFVITKILSK